MMVSTDPHELLHAAVKHIKQAVELKQHAQKHLNAREPILLQGSSIFSPGTNKPRHKAPPQSERHADINE